MINNKLIEQWYHLCVVIFVSLTWICSNKNKSCFHIRVYVISYSYQVYIISQRTKMFHKHLMLDIKNNLYSIHTFNPFVYVIRRSISFLLEWINVIATSHDHYWLVQLCTSTIIEHYMIIGRPESAHSRISWKHLNP